MSSTREEDSPQYSPLGTRIAFSSGRSGLMQVWVCDQDGNNPVQLTHFDTGPSGTPRWSPDGKWITFDHQQDGVLRILVMASDGGQVRRLTPESSDQEAIPSWSGDGKWIYYSCNRSGRFEVWKAPAQGGKGSQVTHNGGFVAFESRDEKSLYYTKEGSPQLWALPLAGGNEKAIVDYVDGRAFAVVEDGIYYIGKGRRDTESSIYFYRFAIGKSEEIVPLQVQPTP